MTPAWTHEGSSAAPRRALFVLPLLGQGGAETVLATLARALADRPGWQVTVAALGALPGAGLALDLGRAEVRPGSGGGCLGSEWRVLRHAGGRRFDLVMSSHLRVNAALCLFRRLGLLRTRRLVTRESTVLADRAGGARMSAYRLLYRAYGVQDLVIAQTPYMAERLRDVLPPAARRSLVVAANPVDMDAIRRKALGPLATPLADRLRARGQVVWCGRLVPVKDPLLAIETLARLRADHGRDLGLVMIGDGPMRSAVEARRDALGLADHVTLAGHLGNPYPVMASARMGLLTSRSEGFPNVLLEMATVGVGRIVATPCSGDLDQVPGLTVTGPGAVELAAALAEADRAGPPRAGADLTDPPLAAGGRRRLAGSEARDLLPGRDPGAFLNLVLGSAGRPAGGPR